MKNKSPIRIIVGVASIIFIIVMWAGKDVASVYASTPSEQLLPLIVTTLLVSLLKVAAITVIVLLGKWTLGKFTHK